VPEAAARHPAALADIAGSTREWRPTRNLLAPAIDERYTLRV
jgi:hypothetical protein